MKYIFKIKKMGTLKVKPIDQLKKATILLSVELLFGGTYPTEKLMSKKEISDRKEKLKMFLHDGDKIDFYKQKGGYHFFTRGLVLDGGFRVAEELKPHSVAGVRDQWKFGVIIPGRRFAEIRMFYNNNPAARGRQVAINTWKILSATYPDFIIFAAQC